MERLPEPTNVTDTTNKEYLNQLIRVIRNNIENLENATGGISDIVSDAIVNGVTTVAPSQNAVYDALALKLDAASIPVKATGAEADTGTDDAKFLTAKAVNDSHNIPSVAPSTSGNIMTSNGTDWVSSSNISKATGAEIDTGTDDAKYATAKALKDSHNVPSVAPSTSGNLLVSDGTDWTSAARKGVIDSAYVAYTTSTGHTTTIPHDDTIPQVGEGEEILSATITPKNTTNKIRATAHMFVQTSSGTINGAAAMFVNGGSDAVQAVTGATGNTGRPWVLSMQYEYVPGSTSTQTISVRVGPDSAGTLYVNVNSGSTRVFGGVARATLVLEEIIP